MDEYRISIGLPSFAENVYQTPINWT